MTLGLRQAGEERLLKLRGSKIRLKLPKKSLLFLEKLEVSNFWLRMYPDNVSIELIDVNSNIYMNYL